MSAGSVSRPLTFLFMPESAYGPTNNCVGIGDVLLRRGHRVVFAAEASWAGKLAALGFEEDLVDLAPPAPPSAEGAAEADPGAFWKEFIRETAPEFRKPTVEQLETFMAPTWQALVDGARYCEPQLRRDHRTHPAGRDRPGQRRGVPRAAHRWRPLRTHHVVQPVGDARRRHPAGLLGAARRRPLASGRPSEPSTTARTVRFGRRSTSGSSSRALRRCPTSSSSTPRRRPTSTSIPRSPTTPIAGRSTPPGTGSTPPCVRPTSRWSCRRRSPTGRPGARSSTCLSARSGRPTST